MQDARETGTGTGPYGPDRASGYVDTVYEALRTLAAGYLARQTGHTLQPTALVHEAYLRLSRQPGDAYRDRTHFMAVAARAMRQILVDHARRKTARKRGGGRDRYTFDEATMISDEREFDVLALHDAVDRLTALDERKGRVVELRVFGGLTIEETAATLGVSGVTISKDWGFARAWLARELEPAG